MLTIKNQSIRPWHIPVFTRITITTTILLTQHPVLHVKALCHLIGNVSIHQLSGEGQDIRHVTGIQEIWQRWGAPECPQHSAGVHAHLLRKLHGVAVCQLELWEVEEELAPWGWGRQSPFADNVKGVEVGKAWWSDVAVGALDLASTHWNVQQHCMKGNEQSAAHGESTSKLKECLLSNEQTT